MRRNCATQSLSYPIRLPDAVQADALRLLDVSREVINATLIALWDRLDAFDVRETTFAYKQVTAMIGSSDPHGDRQWRCEAIKQALTDLRDEQSDGGSAVELQGLIEQACNFYLKHGCFPNTCEEMQAMPVLKVGVLPYAGDDGGEKGQAYRLRLDLEGRCCCFAFRFPDEAGVWSDTWTEPQLLLPLPDPVVECLQVGVALAPTLREIREQDGTRFAVLDFIVEVPVTEPAEWKHVRYVLGWDWGVRTLVTATVLDAKGNQVAPPLFLDSGGVDGRQAHTRRHIDRLKSKVARLEAQRDRFPEGDPRREIACCWCKYSARNRDLAHLAANILLLLATVWEVELIAGESLKSLKTTGRGRSARGRWVHWRNNSQIRGELWRCLRYKCFLSGIRLEWQQPKDTSHTCPRCGKPSHTYASPAHPSTVVDSGAWLACDACGWNGARDYAAAVNIARLGIAFLKQYLQTGRISRPCMTETEKVKNSASSIGAGLALRLPPTSPRGRLIESGKMYVNGWIKAVTLHSALPQDTLLRLCG